MLSNVDPLQIEKNVVHISKNEMHWPCVLQAIEVLADKADTLLSTDLHLERKLLKSVYFTHNQQHNHQIMHAPYESWIIGYFPFALILKCQKTQDTCKGRQINVERKFVITIFAVETKLEFSTHEMRPCSGR